MTILTSSVEERKKEEEIWGSDAAIFNPLDQQMLPWTSHMKFNLILDPYTVKDRTVCVVQWLAVKLHFPATTMGEMQKPQDDLTERRGREIVQA